MFSFCNERIGMNILSVILIALFIEINKKNFFITFQFIAYPPQRALNQLEKASANRQNILCGFRYEFILPLLFSNMIIYYFEETLLYQ